ncbi:hypothetical protein ScPMuIL_017593 [Solemya velum]
MDLQAMFDIVAQRSDNWYGSSENTSNSSLYMDFLTRHPSLSYTYLSVLGVLTIIGNIGNIMVIGSVLSYKPLRTTGNLFIANLALADLCVTAIVDPFSIVGVVNGPQFFMDKPLLCHVVACICLASCTCSMWNIAAVAINRYVFLCKPQLYPVLFTWRKTLSYCLLLWLVCFALEVPNMTGWGGHTFDLKTMACSYDRLANITYTYTFCAVGILLPIIAVFISYLKIFIYARRTRKELKRISGSKCLIYGKSKYKSRRQEELQLARTLFCVCIIFLICWTPYATVVVLDYDDRWSKIVYVVVIQMAHTNSSVNFMLYWLMNQRFKRGYQQFASRIQKCIKMMRPRRHNNSSLNLSVSCTSLTTRDSVNMLTCDNSLQKFRDTSRQDHTSSGLTESSFSEFRKMF